MQPMGYEKQMFLKSRKSLKKQMKTFLGTENLDEMSEDSQDDLQQSLSSSNITVQSHDTSRMIDTSQRLENRMLESSHRNDSLASDNVALKVRIRGLQRDNKNLKSQIKKLNELKTEMVTLAEQYDLVPLGTPEDQYIEVFLNSARDALSQAQRDTQRLSNSQPRRNLTENKDDQRIYRKKCLDLEAKLAEMDRQLIQANEEILYLKNLNKVKGEEFTSLMRELNEEKYASLHRKDSELILLSEKLSNLQSENDRLANAYMELEQREESLSAENEELVEQNQILRNSSRDLASQLEQRMAQLHEAQERLKQTEEEEKELADEILEIKKNFMDMHSSLNKQKTILSNREDLLSLIRALWKQLSSLNAEDAKSYEQLLAEEKAETEASIREANTKLNKKQMEVANKVDRVMQENAQWHPNKD